jgi:hypothetical protein
MVSVCVEHLDGSNSSSPIHEVLYTNRTHHKSVIGSQTSAVVAEVVQRVSELNAKFGLDPDVEWLERAAGILDDCVLMFSTGLLLHAFSTAGDKVSLRDAMVKTLAILKARNVAQDRLPRALATRVAAALAFKVVI